MTSIRSTFGIPLVLSIVCGGVASAQVTTLANDSAAHYTSWGQGQQAQGGFGFGEWQHLFSVPTGGFAGQFLATANNPDLNNVGPTAWGMFSNDGGQGGSGIQKAASLRTFTQGTLTANQTFSIDMEHGNVRAGNGNPNNGPVDFGWVGVVLRSGTFGQELEDPFSPFGELKGVIGVGFLGGASEYLVYDSMSSSGRSTGMPFTDAGVRINIVRFGGINEPFNGQVKLTNLANNSVTITPVRIDGAINAFGIFSRNVELADAFFNNASLSQPDPLCDSIDFNNDGGFFDPTDIDAFLSVFSEGPCIPANANCNDIDFNNDGGLFDPCDIDAFLLAFSEGPCTSCGL